MERNSTGLNASSITESETQQLQCFTPIDTAVGVMNLALFIINAFHLSIILRLGSLRGTPYRYVLINIALADMCYTARVSVSRMCDHLYGFYMMAGELGVRIALTSVLLAASCIDYHIFLIASVQKYLAICKPIKYQSSIICRRLSAVFVAVWLYVLAICPSFSAIDILYNVPLWFIHVQSVILTITPNLISSFLLIKVYRAMNKRSREKTQHGMKSQQRRAKDEDEEMRGATYLLIIFTTEMIVFVIQLIGITLYLSLDVSAILSIWSGFVKAPYTVANMVIYGWRTKAYRQCVRKVLGCKAVQVTSPETTQC